MRLLVFIVPIILLCAACKKGADPDIAQVEPEEQYAGGANGTTFDFGQNAFGGQVSGLSSEQSGFFVTGNSFFRSNWIIAPASVQTLDGLGPIFNAFSCGSCHFKDGRAKPPGQPEEPLNGLLFRLSIPGTDAHGGPLGDPVYGGQLQDKAILNVLNEARVRVTYQEMSGQYPDGTTYAFRQPSYEFIDLNYGPLAPGWMFSPRIAPQMPGLGLLEIVPDADILAFADENDTDQNGISGRANQVWNVEKQQVTLGRFGWKANQPDLTHQTAGAFNGDLGITSNLFPQDHLSPTQQQQYPNVPNGGTPEIQDDIFQKVVRYTQTLAVPARRDHDDVTVLRGKFLFNQINCSGCHRPEMSTGTGGNIAALHNQKIRPYTDLLLHDMGPDLADNRPDFLATGTEWRTPPLWGIGMIPTVNGHSFLLHDGRARNIEEAILWHGGESEKSLEDFKKLSKVDREALLKFVESL
ncbi:MAG: di-heme oxidoredictase family protein [Saprospiraceae bacterium]|nr:di-heme oxidoredictase family protein [Saprospiraceae bacterium]